MEQTCDLIEKIKKLQAPNSKSLMRDIPSLISSMKNINGINFGRHMSLSNCQRLSTELDKYGHLHDAVFYYPKALCDVEGHTTGCFDQIRSIISVFTTGGIGNLMGMFASGVKRDMIDTSNQLNNVKKSTVGPLCDAVQSLGLNNAKDFLDEWESIFERTSNGKTKLELVLDALDAAKKVNLQKITYRAFPIWLQVKACKHGF